MRLFTRQNTAEEDIYKRLSYSSERNALFQEIAKAKREIDNAYNNFQNASDPDLIDCYIYEMNSVLKRYKFLMEQAAAILPLPEENTHSAALNAETPVTTLTV